MNVGSLFSGVGGFDLGLERAGYNIKFQCEADEWRRKILAQHWPGIPLSPDVREVTPEWYGGELSDSLAGDGRSDASLRQGDIQPSDQAPLDIDLICGGFPCQDLSVAGKRAGLAGARSGLFYEAVRVADAFLGDGGWLLIENVPGLLSSNGGRDFGIVLASLADLGFHDLAWRVLDSRFIPCGGRPAVAQRRRRVFILARRARGRCAAEVLLEPESGGGDFAPSREAKQGAAGASGRGAEGGGRADGAAEGSAEAGSPSTADSNGVREAPGVSGRLDNPSFSPPVTKKWQKGSGGPAGDECQNLVTAFHATQDPITNDDVTPALGKQSKVGVRAFVQNSRDEVRFMGDNGEGDHVGALNAQPGSHQQSYLLTEGVSMKTAQTGSNGIGIRSGEVGTLDKSTGPAVYSHGRESNSCALDVAPDGPRFAAMGDAVTVNVAEWIGRRLMAYGK